MLVDTKPTTFDELIRISGLSHGTDVWLGNAQTLIEEGTTTLQNSICCRDDIMIYLIKKGVPPNPAFKIMETVRKGKALKDKEKWAENVALMKEHNVPDWYIKSCEKIKYMFPKAHAAAYVTNAFRIAWFKVHQPKAYYTAYFTIRADEFDSEIMCYGKEKVKNKMKEIDLAGNNATTKDKNMYAILELVLEMYERGIKFLPIDLYKSHATKFQIEEDRNTPTTKQCTRLRNSSSRRNRRSQKRRKIHVNRRHENPLKNRKLSSRPTKENGMSRRNEPKQPNEPFRLSSHWGRFQMGNLSLLGINIINKIIVGVATIGDPFSKQILKLIRKCRGTGHRACYPIQEKILSHIIYKKILKIYVICDRIHAY